MGLVYIFISLYNLHNNVKKNVLIRGIDEGTYRRAKSAATARGISVGKAMNEALDRWAKDAAYADLETEFDANLAFVASNWEKLRESRGKAVVVAGGVLRGVFNGYPQARAFASKFRLAVAFVVDEPPLEREIEIGPELEV